MVVTYYIRLLIFNKINLIVYRSLRPVVLEPYEPLDDIDGYPEKNLPRKSPDYFKAREVSFHMFSNDLI